MANVNLVGEEPPVCFLRSALDRLAYTAGERMDQGHIWGGEGKKSPVAFESPLEDSRQTKAQCGGNSERGALSEGRADYGVS